MNKYGYMLNNISLNNIIMNRKDADKHVDKLKGLGHLDVQAYKHIAKLFEYILYELDGIKDREAELPSVYGSWNGEPLYKDYQDEREEDEEVILPDIVELMDDAVDDRDIPMVLSYESATPFREAHEAVAVEKAPEPEVVEVKTPEIVHVEASGTVVGDEVDASGVKLDTAKPLRLKVVGEGEKKALHSSSLKRVKESLRTIRKKKDNITAEIVKE